MNNYKSQKALLARKTSSLMYAQKANRLVCGLVFLAMAVGLTACGGGGSSSGGGIENITVTSYRGSYKTPLYNGSITIHINGADRPVVTLTGVQCVQGSFNESLGQELRGSERLISGLITELSIPGNISLRFPNAGGEGYFFLGLPTELGCSGSSEGIMSVLEI